MASAYGTFHNDTDVRALLPSHQFDPNSCLIAEQAGSTVGSVAVTTLPRPNWFVIRYLAVAQKKERTEVAEALLTRAMDYTKSRKPEYVRATTPAIEPYVGVYKKLGFVPVRRDFRISWDLVGLTREEKTVLKVEEVSRDRSGDAAQMFVKTLSPYWDWRTEEHGGPDAFLPMSSVKE